MGKTARSSRRRNDDPAQGGRKRADRPSRAEAESAVRTLIRWAGDNPDREGLLGKSSIAYVNEADKTRPKSQQYKIYVDAPIAPARA